ncbi:MAG: hypothetical protein F6K16_43270 [Symploca sp. SIO2B6]|nr:hypothetical protein [Symploca sp. SIO2B6]
MKYEINRRRLPKAPLDQVYTLTIFVDVISDDDPSPREAKIQYPVMSYSEGIRKYREIKRIQHSLDAGDPMYSSTHDPQTIQSIFQGKICTN